MFPIKLTYVPTLHFIFLPHIYSNLVTYFTQLLVESSVIKQNNTGIAQNSYTYHLANNASVTKSFFLALLLQQADNTVQTSSKNILETNHDNA